MPLDMFLRRSEETCSGQMFGSDVGLSGVSASCKELSLKNREFRG